MSTSLSPRKAGAVSARKAARYSGLRLRCVSIQKDDLRAFVLILSRELVVSVNRLAVCLKISREKKRENQLTRSRDGRRR